MIHSAQYARLYLLIKALSHYFEQSLIHSPNGKSDNNMCLWVISKELKKECIYIHSF